MGRDVVNVTFIKDELRMVLQLGPTFNYKKALVLDIPLHSQSKLEITVKFVSVDKCKLNESSINYPAISTNSGPFEFKITGNKDF